MPGPGANHCTGLKIRVIPFLQMGTFWPIHRTDYQLQKATTFLRIAQLEFFLKWPIPQVLHLLLLLPPLGGCRLLCVSTDTHGVTSCFHFDIPLSPFAWLPQGEHFLVLGLRGLESELEQCNHSFPHRCHHPPQRYCNQPNGVASAVTRT